MRTSCTAPISAITARLMLGPERLGLTWWMGSRWQDIESGFTARSLRPSHPPLTSADALRVAFAGRRRPLCVRGCRVSGSVRSTNRGGTRHGRARTGPRTATDQPTDGGGPAHGRGRRRPRTGAEKATDGAGRSGYADPSHPDSRSDLPFQDDCSMSPSPSSPRSCSVSRVPRASAMRWLAAVAWPSMQWA